MRLPAALTPLRHSAYRSLWLAYVVTSLGTWLQNTGAGWLMTTLAPNPLIVSMVQAATILPVFMLALPARVRAGALSLIYALAIAIFGGTTQLVEKLLIRWTENPVAPSSAVGVRKASRM